MCGKRNNICNGEAYCNGTCISATVYGLSDGDHGFHIHTEARSKSRTIYFVNILLSETFLLGNIYSNCADTGGHYNPDGVLHALPIE